MGSWNDKSVENATKGIANLFFYSFKEFDKVGHDITDGDLTKVDLHDDWLFEVITMNDKISYEKEKGLVKILTDLDPKIWVLDPSEYAKSFDLKGKYALSEFTFVVDFPLKVMNTWKWCDFMRRKVENDSV